MIDRGLVRLQRSPRPSCKKTLDRSPSLMGFVIVEHSSIRIAAAILTLEYSPPVVSVHAVLRISLVESNPRIVCIEFVGSTSRASVPSRLRKRQTQIWENDSRVRDCLSGSRAMSGGLLRGIAIVALVG